MTTEKLKEVLNAHSLWLKGDPKGQRADLSHRNLRGADLSRADLSKANLCGTDLFGANLRGAHLTGANLYVANLSYANLSSAYLCEADLSQTVLSSADLRNTNLRGASLRGASLYCTDLCGSNLHGTDLSEADLCGADLFRALLDEHENIRKGITLTEPMLGYKKCRGNCIVTLEIPIGAIVYSINNNKCRTNRAKAISIVMQDDTSVSYAQSYYDISFFYKVGKEIDISETFNLMYNVECSTGIHFFRTREEAENYKF